jgi:branched-chain amino acid transport system substrate-binding protein
VAVAATIVSLVLAACTAGATPSAAPATSGPATSGPATSGPTTAPAPSGPPIKVGGTLGLTGVYSGPSAGYKATYEYWAKGVNASGGLLGRPVQVVIYDDESTPATAATLYQRLINQDKVDLLLAPYTTAVSSTIIPIAEQNKMVVWNGGFVNTAIFKKSPWVVTSYAHLEKDYTRGVYDMIATMTDKPTKVAIVTEQNPFALGIRNGYEGDGGALKLAQDRGLQVVLNEEYAPNTTDFSSLIQRAKGADLFFALSLPNPAGLIAKAVNDAKYKPKVYCSCASEVTSLANWADLGAAGVGVISVTSGWPTDKTPGIQELFDALKQSQGYKQLPNYAVVGMAILEIMQQAVEGTKGLDQTQLREYVKNRTFQTVEGPLKFTTDAYPEFSATYLQWQGTENVVVWPKEKAGGSLITPIP